MLHAYSYQMFKTLISYISVIYLLKYRLRIHFKQRIQASIYNSFMISVAASPAWVKILILNQLHILQTKETCNLYCL